MSRDDFEKAVIRVDGSANFRHVMVDFMKALRDLYQTGNVEDAWADGADLLHKYGIHPLVQENDTDGSREA